MNKHQLLLCETPYETPCEMPYKTPGLYQTVLIFLYCLSLRLPADFKHFKISLKIELSVSACFFKITVIPISFSNVKWIWILLESLIIELCLHVKIYLDYFPGSF